MVTLDDDHDYQLDAIQTLVQAKKNDGSNSVLSLGGREGQKWNLDTSKWSSNTSKGNPTSNTIHADPDSSDSSDSLTDFQAIHSASAFSGAATKPKNKPKNTLVAVDIIEGWQGVAYRAGDFDDIELTTMEVLAHPSITANACKLSDDLIISVVLALFDHGKFKVSGIEQPHPLQGIEGGLQFQDSHGNTTQTRAEESRYSECLKVLDRIFSRYLKATSPANRKKFRDEILKELLTVTFSIDY